MSQERDTSKDKYIYIKFAIIFFFTLGMIIWTIMETAKAGVGLDDDNAFLSTYHDVDSDFNKMAVENNKFNSLYNIKFDINDQSVYGLEVADIYLSQRVIKERKEKQDMFKVGKNSISIHIQDKQGNTIDSKNIQMMVTKSTTHEYDVKLDFQNETTKEFDVATVGYWNLTGVVEVNGQKGYFYIKTNATSK